MKPPRHLVSLSQMMHSRHVKLITITTPTTTTTMTSTHQQATTTMTSTPTTTTTMTSTPTTTTTMTSTTTTMPTTTTFRTLTCPRSVRICFFAELIDIRHSLFCKFSLHNQHSLPSTGRKEGRTGGWLDGTDGWTDGWMVGRMDGRMDGWMDGWMDGRESERRISFAPMTSTGSLMLVDLKAPRLHKLFVLLKGG